MRVSMPTIYGNIQTQLQKLAEELQKANIALSTGKKYQQISDNPVEVGALMGLNLESAQVVQYQSNLDTAKDWLGTTETTLENINDLVSSTASLAEQMATGTYTAAQRAAAAQTVQQYMEEMMQMGNVRNQGNYLLSGYKIDTEPFSLGAFTIQQPEMQQAAAGGTAVSSGTYTGTSSATYVVELTSDGATGAADYRFSTDGGQTWTTGTTSADEDLGNGVHVTFNNNWVAGDRFTISVYQPIEYHGDENTLELGIGRNSRLAVSQVGSQVLGGSTPPGANDLFQIMATLKSKLEANDAGGVGASLEDLRSFQTHLTSVMAGQGAALNRVDAKQNAYDAIKEGITTNIGNKGDTDIVEGTTALATKQLAYQAALQAATQVMNMSLMDYL
jgi:flagellar hook-associated protein 3 FlgL